MNGVTVRMAQLEDLPSVNFLLQSAKLPMLGVAEHFETFLVALGDNGIVGTIGLEVYGSTALLRSAVVAEQERGRGIGQLLYDELLSKARHLQIRRLILLTNTAEEYFRRKGFRTIEPRTVTGPITTSAEFSGACPAHAACMELLL